MGFDNLSSSDFQHFVYSVLILLVLISGLASRREMGISKILKYLGIWSAIILVIISAYSYRYEFTDFKDRLLGEINPAQARIGKSGTIIIDSSQDGHFYMNVKINGAPVRFMIDTGASDIVLNYKDAKKIGVNFKKLNFDRRYQTANGTALGATVSLDKIEVGNVEFNNVSASVNQSDMGTSLLGMSFLRKFKRYEFYQDQLILTSF